MKAIFFTEAGNKYGLGHLIRCVSLAQGLHLNDVICNFYIDSDSNQNAFLDKFNFKILNWRYCYKNLDLTDYDICVVDSYHSDESFYKYVCSKVKKCIYFDDFNRIEYPNGFILNPVNPEDNHSYYSYKNKDQLLIGYQYQLFRKQFWNHKAFNVNDDVKTITVTFGGSDVGSFTISILVELLKRNININVISSNESVIELSKHNNISVFNNLQASEIIEKFLESDIVITAAGQTLLELISLNVPTIVIQIADNQLNNINRLIAENCITFAGHKDDKLLLKNITRELNSLTNSNKRYELSRKCKNILDTKGVERVVNKILK